MLATYPDYVSFQPYCSQVVKSSDNEINAVDWTDCARDILQFALHYLPDDMSESKLPTALDRVPQETTQQRRQNGLAHRTLVGIGHSFAAMMTCVSSYLPQGSL
jgi:hypothetical protein